MQVFLTQPYLETALGENLQIAANNFTANIKPQPKAILSLDKQHHLGFCFYIKNKNTNVINKLNNIITNYQNTQTNFNKTLLILATTSQLVAAVEADLANKQKFTADQVISLDTISNTLEEKWGFAAAFSINTACTSAANALIYATELIKNKVYQQALILTFETPSQYVTQGFGALGLTSLSGNYQPFHPESDGLILGEAYAACLLTPEASTNNLAEILGGASRCDTSSMTSTQTDGSHIKKVVDEAFLRSGVSNQHIELVKHHGTGTSFNDQAEAAAIQSIFTTNQPVSCCLKPWVGHTLGACGLVESNLLLYALAKQLSLPNLDYAADATINLPTGASEFNFSQPLVLANFSGFGGNNASLIYKSLI